MTVLIVLVVKSDPVMTSNVTTAPVTESPSSSSGPTMSPEEVCTAAGKNCDDCIGEKKVTCFFCDSSKTCNYYKIKGILPSSKNCDMGDIRVGVCWLNFKVMIITVSVVAGVLIISIIICCCCCCRKKKRTRLVQDDAKREREKEERRIRGLERQKERQSRNDEIRRKYGLIKDDHPYQKFDSQHS